MKHSAGYSLELSERAVWLFWTTGSGIAGGSVGRVVGIARVAPERHAREVRIGSRGCVSGSRGVDRNGRIRTVAEPCFGLSPPARPVRPRHGREGFASGVRYLSQARTRSTRLGRNGVNPTMRSSA